MMAHQETHGICQSIYDAMAGDRADRYVSEFLVPSLLRSQRHRYESPIEAVDVYGSSFRCLAAIFGHYGFSRRGRERAELAATAIEALHRTGSEDDFGQFLGLSNAQVLWDNFVEVCHEHRRKPLEQLNAGVVAGMAELAQEIYRIDGRGSIALWIVDGIRRTGRCEPQFLRMVDVRGIGPKLASLIMRDVIHFFDVESLIDPIDRLYMIPIDKWMRQVAPYAIDEERAEDLADWMLAGKIAKYARKCHVSSVRFTMGTTFFGLRELRAGEDFEDRIEQVVGARFFLK